MTLALVAPGTVWWRWVDDPLAAASLLVLCLAYAGGVRQLWAHAGAGAVVRRWQTRAFTGGLVACGIALVSPLAALAHTLLSAHMVQHLLLVLVAAPLLVAGAPLLPLVHALPAGWQRRAQRVRARPWLRRASHSLAGMMTACAAHLAVMWGWHVPALYEAAVASTVVHAVEHVTMLGSAMWVWTTILQAGGPTRRARPAGAIAMFLTGTLSVGLGPLMVFTSTAWYPIYAQGAALWGLTPLQDQQAAGGIMWGIGGLAYPLFGALLFARWLDDDRRRPDRLARRSQWWQTS